MKKREELFEKKLGLYFHDSPDKPFILLTGKNHEKRAQKVSERLGLTYSKGKASDIVASSMERYYLPKGASRNKNLQVRFEYEPEFIHPLSGKRYDKFTHMEHTIFMKALDAAIDEISSIQFNNNFEMYVYIWRYMNETLKKYTPIEYRKYWDVAPADTRFPNHTIFDHLQVTSSIDADIIDGINLNNMTLFLLTIGPVQDYIAQARKTQDLYWGSYILSYLTWKAIEKVVETYGPDSIIFPDLMGQPLCDLWIINSISACDFNADDLKGLKTPTIPNRFFALLPTKNIEDIRQLKLKKVIKDEFEKIGNHVLDLLLHCDDAQKELFKGQLKQFPSVYWTALSLKNGDIGKSDWEMQLDKMRVFLDDKELSDTQRLLQFIKEHGEYKPNIGNIYGVLYFFMGKMMGARKGIRNFYQFEETGRKCSICGEYNTIIYRLTRSEEQRLKKGRESYKLFILKNQKAVIKASHDSSTPYKYINQGEGLCSICFAKRAAELYFRTIIGPHNIEYAFPSTAEIALLDVINNSDNALNLLIERYKNISGDNFDYGLLYDENLNEAYFEKYGFDARNLLELKMQLKEIDEKIKGLDLNKKRYYALIKLDGDDMGKWLSGELAPRILDMYNSKLRKNIPENFRESLINKKRLVTPAIHVAISRALKNYSLNYVENVVEMSGAGRVIYSGGDDVLAIINLDSLMDVMSALRAGFSGNLNNRAKPDFIADTGFIEYDDRIDIFMGGKATASMGVVIAHYKENLRDVINSVNYAERHAKASGKDAFTIHLMLRSGKELMATAKWRYFNKESMIDILKEINSILDDGKISTSFVKKLYVSLANLDNVSGLPGGIFNNELRRNIINSLGDSIDKDEKIKIVDKLYNLLSILNSELGYENFINMLFILVFLNRGGKD